MSKLVAFLVAAAGASTVSVGGTFLLKSHKTPQGQGGSSDNGASGNNAGGQSLSTPEQLTLYDSVDAFKTAKGDKCVHDLFGKDLDMSNVSSSTLPTDSTDYFGTKPTDATTEKTKGCLIINWKKENKDSKWSGTFTWSWSFKNQKKGFIIFGVAKTNNASPKKLDLSGITYLLEEGTDTNPKWTIKHSKGSESNSSVSDTDQEFDKKFPKAKTGVDVIRENKDHWGFIDNKESLKSICDTSCTSENPTVESSRFQWDWKKDGGSHNISDWCENLDWWGKLFNDNSFNLSTKLNGFTGTWTKQFPTS